MSHIVQCRVCKQKIDTDTMQGWMMPSTNYYYHCNCYTEWLNKRGSSVINENYSTDEWKKRLFDYIWKDIKLPGADFKKISSQWSNFTNGTKQFTPKGVYFAVIYYYEVMHGDVSKAQGGIGIVPSIYMDSAQYWADREQRRAGTIAAILQQMEDRAHRATVSVKEVRPRDKSKARFSLDSV